jgi:predicted transcriptional regulator of viral defense system
MDQISRLKAYKNRSFTVAEAAKKGVQQFALVYLARSGQLKRLAHGLYAFPDYAPTDLSETIADFLKVIPQAVVGLDSALQIYNLADQLVEEITLIVPGYNVPKRKLEGVKYHQLTKNFDKLELQKVNDLPVTSINQTIVDLLKTGRPLSVVVDIFHQAQGRKDLNLSISKIKNLAAVFRAKARIKVFLEAIGS